MFLTAILSHRVASVSRTQFARRLQAQEMGLQGFEQTPLMLERLVRPTVRPPRGVPCRSASRARLTPVLAHVLPIVQATPGNNAPHNNNGNRGNRNPTVINARLNELSSARATVCAILTVNTPQIMATLVVLVLHWNDPLICDEAHAQRWKWWSLVSALRMLSYSTVVVFSHFFKVKRCRDPLVVFYRPC